MLEILVVGPEGKMKDLDSVVRTLVRARSIEGEGVEFWRNCLPGWLIESFSPESSREEKVAWLAVWRKSDPVERLRLSSAKGWELMQWSYWFSHANEDWELDSTEWVNDNSALKILLEGAREEYPIEAIRWLIEKSGCRVVEVVHGSD